MTDYMAQFFLRRKERKDESVFEGFGKTSCFFSDGSDGILVEVEVILINKERNFPGQGILKKSRCFFIGFFQVGDHLFQPVFHRRIIVDFEMWRLRDLPVELMQTDLILRKEERGEGAQQEDPANDLLSAEFL